MHTPTRYFRIALIFAFVTCFVGATLVMQARSSRPPWLDGSPIEYFTGSLLWMLSIICLLMAGRHGVGLLRRLFWIAGCATLAVLAIDEFFEFHEKLESNDIANDDWPKIFAWIATAGVLIAVMRLEGSSRLACWSLFVGYVFHATYLVAEIGDGEFFHIPFATRTGLKWTEELSELIFLSSYLIGFALTCMSAYGAAAESEAGAGRTRRGRKGKVRGRSGEKLPPDVRAEEYWH